MQATFPDPFAAAHARAGRIRITAYDPLGGEVSRATYGESVVYGGSIAIIDDPNERASAGIVKIVAEQIDARGRSEARWTMHYDHGGALREAFETRTDFLPPSARDLSQMLMQRLRWLAAPLASGNCL